MRSGFITYTSIITVLVSIVVLYDDVNNYTTNVINTGHYDPCCAYPCQNQGECLTLSNSSFICYCDENSGYYGRFCEKKKFWLRFSPTEMFKPNVNTMHNILTGYEYLWKIINNIPFLHTWIIKYIYLSRHDIIDSPSPYQSDHTFITLDSYINQSYYVRTLPPVPIHCPTPTGVSGANIYPDIDILIDSVFMRRGGFIPDSHNTNVLFLHYAQHFTHQFFRTDFKRGPQFIVENSYAGGVDASNLYGLDEYERRALRTGTGGKLKTQIIDGEEFPPSFYNVYSNNKNDYYPSSVAPTEKFALGHPFFSLLPGLFAFSTIWIREHNRVCDILAHEHAHWDDERLYQTTRLIIVAQMIKITIEEYVQHLSQYNLKLIFDPKLIHDTHFQFHNRIHAEFNHLYHWHPLVPDFMYVNDTKYFIRDTLFSTKPIFKHGLDQFIYAMVKTRAGALTIKNHSYSLRSTLKKFLENSRKLRFQSINAYRRRFDMTPFQSFEEMTGGDEELSNALKILYDGDIDSVEFYVGLLADKQNINSVTPLSMVTMGGPWSIKGLLSNPICSPKFWKPYTFGGDVGMDIIKNASLKNLFCNNMRSGCNIEISFRVP